MASCIPLPAAVLHHPDCDLGSDQYGDHAGAASLHAQTSYPQGNRGSIVANCRRDRRYRLFALWLADVLFKIDFRFWVVALKLPSATQWMIMLIYLMPFTLFFVVALHAQHRNFSRAGAAAAGHYATMILSLSLGFIILVGGQYLALWLGGKLINPVPTSPVVPLSTIIAIQFIPLLAIIAVISTFTWRRTGSSLPGALICGLFVTWYIVAGTATQAPF